LGGLKPKIGENRSKMGDNRLFLLFISSIKKSGVKAFFVSTKTMKFFYKTPKMFSISDFDSNRNFIAQAISE